MDTPPGSEAVLDFVLLAEKYYSELARAGEIQDQSCTPDERSLGGKLLYVGELDEHGRALVVAGNVAGAATLAVTADVSAQKQAVREGTVDFLVTSLDEALRILKNQIRKRETVAVCVAVAPQSLEVEMHVRGVQPDLLGPGVDGFAFDGLAGSRLRRIRRPNPEGGEATLTLQVAHSSAAPMTLLDSIARECLAENAVEAHRWLRLAPRYLGRVAQGIRVLRCDLQTARQIAARVEGAIEGNELQAEILIQITVGNERIN